MPQLLSTVRSIAEEKTLTPTNEGGMVYEIGPLARLRRFLILGTASGSFYASAKSLTEENIAAINAALDDNFLLALQLIEEVSDRGRAVKNDTAILALAIATIHPRPLVRSQAFRVTFPKVCRTASHVLMFAAFRAALGKKNMGRAYANAITNWVYDRDPEDLAYQLTKYQDRNGWKMTDLVSQARVDWRRGEVARGRILQKERSEHALILDVIMNKDGLSAETVIREQFRQGRRGLEGLKYLSAVKAAQVAFAAGEARTATALMAEARMPWEVIPSEALNHRWVWQELLQSNMPLTALVRNLGKMTTLGIFTRAEDVERVCARLTDEGAIRGARLHPLFLLNAWKTYVGGKSIKGSLEWNPNYVVADTLERAFYIAMQVGEPTGKQVLVAVDVSPSMFGSNLAGLQITCAEAAAVMAMTLLRQESGRPILKAFTDSLVDLPLDAEDTLSEVLQKIGTAAQHWGGTDAAKPIQWATRHATPVDAFITITDVESMGYPGTALKVYRKKVNGAAQMINVAMVANKLSLADPADPRSLDVVGFDTATPQAISAFLRGDV